MVAPDDITFEYLAGSRLRAPRRRCGTRPSPIGARCTSDPDADFDREHTIEHEQGGAADHLGHQAPEHVIRRRQRRFPIRPTGPEEKRGRPGRRRCSIRDSKPGKPIEGTKGRLGVSIGSCTNSRISDLRRPPPPSPRAATKADHVTAWIVAGLGTG